MELARSSRGRGEITAAAPAVAQNQDGRLEVHLRVGEQIWHAWQKTAGSHDWVPWTPLGQPEGQGPVGLPTVALDVDGLFALRNLPDGTQSLEKLEEEGGAEGLWLAGDPLGIEFLGKPDYVPKVDNPTLASDDRERLRLFASIPGSGSIYYVIQASAGGEEWEDGFLNFAAP